MNEHWLARKNTTNRLWFLFVAILAVIVLMDFAVEHHPHFGLDGSFGFGAWFGFVACVALVAVAKAIGVFLKRSDSYYDD